MTEEQEARLPLYARRELHRLRANLVHAEKQVATVFGDHPETARVVTDPYAEVPLALPQGEHSIVEFRSPLDSDKRRDHFQVRFAIDDPGALYVTGNGGVGTPSLGVIPHASNAVRIRWIPW